MTVGGTTEMVIHYSKGDDKWVQDLVGLLNTTFGIYSWVWWQLEGPDGALHIFQKGANIGWEKVKQDSGKYNVSRYKNQ